ncbi:phage terminase large subunit [Thalassospira sp.]|uniref:phage terminase large subunit n=1 Tax=Thalassospira sp. TaxID=1912094 RepID=UPI0027356138|nr:phage terminase large subunit [Thalassospira sp.]MDP2697576.1 phage terminase large subunit [Thalassospira sp.]
MPQVIGQAGSAGFGEFVWIWNRMLGLSTPGHHRRLAGWLEGCWCGGQRDLLVLAFRNSGKSTLIGLFCAWVLYGNADLRILVLAADLELAKKMVRNVKRIIERHPLLARLVPGRAADWGAERFTVNRPGELRDPSMQAVGIGGNITGSRADLVICDDVEVPKTCDSVHKRHELREKLGEIAYVLSPGGSQIYIGTPHSYYSIYADEARPETGEDAPFLAGFARFFLPVLDDAGQSAWPERFSPAKIADIRQRSGEAKFASQMMLVAGAGEEGEFDPARMHAYDAVPELLFANGEQRLMLAGRRMVSASCHFDPSFGSANGDGAVIAALYVCEQGEYWLQDIEYLRFDPAQVGVVDEASQLCAQAAHFLKIHQLPVVRVEKNGVGQFLPGILRRELKNVRWAASVVEYHESRNKDARIRDAFASVLGAGLLHAHRDIWKTPLIREMREWKPGGGGRDDGLDAVAGCLLAEPVRLPRIARPAWEGDWRPGAQTRTVRSDFAP